MPNNNMKHVADKLAEAREHRLAGRVHAASMLEWYVQQRMDPRYDNDILLMAWEGSLASHPLALPEWQEAVRR